jgi:putative lipoprotein
VVPSRKLRVAVLMFLFAPLCPGLISPAPVSLAPFSPVQSRDNASKSTMHVLRGTVSYHQRVALPPDAVLRVMIKDVSQTDAAAKSLAEEDIPAKGHQMPIKFELKYDPAALDPGHRYSILAKITHGDRLMFTSTNSYPVLTQGAPIDNVAIDLEQVSAQYGQLPGGASAVERLEGTQWNLTELNGKVPENETPQASVTLVESTHRVEGTGGCNRLMGSYELDGRSLHFKDVATTMMACASEAMLQERGFLEVLNATQSYRIHNTTLLLLGKDGKVLARLEAQT